VNIVLDSTSTAYASWRDLMMMILERYALLDHIDSNVASSTDPGWRRMDSVVLNWISNSITPELHQVVRERGATTRHLWLAIENQFLGNREQRTLHLDAAFRNFVQGDLTVSEYCRKFKNMAEPAFRAPRRHHTALHAVPVLPEGSRRLDPGGAPPGQLGSTC
jgi:hypothetical protein